MTTESESTVDLRHEVVRLHYCRHDLYWQYRNSEGIKYRTRDYDPLALARKLAEIADEINLCDDAIDIAKLNYDLSRRREGIPPGSTVADLVDRQSIPKILIHMRNASSSPVGKQVGATLLTDPKAVSRMVQKAEILRAMQAGQRHFCLCGCGGVPKRPQSYFLRGHNPKVKR